MFDFQTLLAAACLVSFGFIGQKLIQRLRRHSIKYLQGPECHSWLVGNLPGIFRAEYAVKNEKRWVEEYGTALHIKGALGSDILYLADPKAMQYIFNTSGYNFHKTRQARVISSLITGKGLSFAEGNIHARQRRIMTPAFHFSTLRVFLPRFRSVAKKTTQKWNEIVQRMGGQGVIEMTSWMSKTTLDAMGETAFNYKFDSLDDGHSDLSRVYTNLIPDSFFKRSDKKLLFEAIWSYIPWWLVTIILRILPTHQLKRIREYMKEARRVARHIIDTARQEHPSVKGGAKDIMSILIKANSSENPKTKLDDESLMAQMTTFMFAGHDTTAATTSWALYHLARHPPAQKKLRDEIRQAKKNAAARGDSDLTIQDLDSMKYLAAVMKETLRYSPILSLLQRQAGRDDIIPLSTPLKTKTGETITSIPVSKGQVIYASIANYNRLKSVWGEDADEWRPERFLDSDYSKKQKTGLGVVANIATFGTGLRSCIGWRFAMTEMQTLLIEFIDMFEYAPVPGKDDIIPATQTIISPMLKGDEGHNQLPLLISPAPDSEDRG
ncbi:hypothetical protein M422DRAFT_263776 [Sphaerobolus stellatus SS14]|uniref:Cytochrome P450 n=1 Tax=Sphaerobolus stellatus (strain SS14) TaxID=990650 RepID=A0A0C9UXU1_SPHS4|nr:hypothetical protein M422DRAFT_263776 [Sphaerobolus stellatus SS14]